MRECLPGVSERLPDVVAHLSRTEEDFLVVVEHLRKVVDESPQVVECSSPVVEVLSHPPGSTDPRLVALSSCSSTVGGSTPSEVGHFLATDNVLAGLDGMSGVFSLFLAGLDGMSGVFSLFLAGFTSVSTGLLTVWSGEDE